MSYPCVIKFAALTYPGQGTVIGYLFFSFSTGNSCIYSVIFSFEILHARWAMLASLGALIPEILDISGAFHFSEPIWWRVGYSKLKVCFQSPDKPSLWISYSVESFSCVRVRVRVYIYIYFLFLAFVL